ncbi:MAG: hypothetical protein HY951_18150 [Bacteroidia bacterium]|nr:hypothetical protein [Bacteroidia bacterium]
MSTINEISKHRGSETSHYNNVANFEVLIAECIGYGTTYNPVKTALKVAPMQTLLTTAKNANTTVNSAIPADRTARDAREEAFEPLSILITRVTNALKSSDISKQIIESAKTYTRKIQGRRATPKISSTEPAQGEPVPGAEITIEQEQKYISTSQMGYDNRLDNFDKLIKFLSSIPQYTPNEAELKVTALTTLYNDLKTKNTAVINATIPLTNAKFSRNAILYKEPVGLYYVASEAKTYIKSLFGANSPQYKLICRLKFTKPRK